MRTHVATDDGAARLGEVALVDGHSRVGQTGLVFYDTLFDENASSHIALGASIVQAVAWAPDLEAEERNERGVNHSSIHTDFMIGSNELEIDGVDAGRQRRADPPQRRLAALEPDVEVRGAAGVLDADRVAVTRFGEPDRGRVLDARGE